MGKIIELRPRDPPPPQGGTGQGAPSDQDTIENATRRLIGTVGELVKVLEESHRRIRTLIDAIPDAEVSARLARDHAVLAAALRDAKAKVASMTLEEPGSSE